MMSYVPPSGDAEPEGSDDDVEEEGSDDAEDDEEDARPPAKKAKVDRGAQVDDEAVLSEAKKIGMKRQLEAIIARPEIAAKGLDMRTIFATLQKSGGKVVQAKRTLL